MSKTLYDFDFYAWTAEQAALLRAGRLNQLDIDNIAEEIETLGRSEKRELVNRLTVLLTHLLKWQYQPGLRGASWRGSIRVQRIDLAAHLADNPSLRVGLDAAIAAAYRKAAIEAETETGLPDKTFPARCPYPFTDAMRDDFWPD
jgi:hypothetical protein